MVPVQWPASGPSDRLIAEGSSAVVATAVPQPERAAESATAIIRCRVMTSILPYPWDAGGSGGGARRSARRCASGAHLNGGGPRETGDGVRRVRTDRPARLRGGLRPVAAGDV